MQPAFRQTTVLVRADIFDKAREQGIDISNSCNQALAEILGIDYRQQRLDDVPVPAPVIIAKDGGLPAPAAAGTPKARPAIRPPVINADDPAAAGVIARSRRAAGRKPAPEPEGKHAEPAERPHEVPVKPVPAPVKRSPEQEQKPAPEPALKPETAQTRPAAPKKPLAKKAAKADPVKKFIAAKVQRDDTADATIPKEELYNLFTRWCREQKAGTIPDARAFAVALKTRFAFKEKAVAGTPCWMHVRVK